MVEAVGEHCCEYMTGGTVVVLGASAQPRRRHDRRPGVRLGPRWTPIVTRSTATWSSTVDSTRTNPPTSARCSPATPPSPAAPRALAMLDDWHRAHREFRLVEPRPEVAAITRKNEGTVHEGLLTRFPSNSLRDRADIELPRGDVPIPTKAVTATRSRRRRLTLGTVARVSRILVTGMSGTGKSSGRLRSSADAAIAS